MWRGKAEEGQNSPSWAGRMCGKQIPPPPPDCLLLLLVPSNSFLSLLCPFFAIRHQESSCLVCVLSVGQGWDGGAQSALADTHSLYLPRVFGQDGGCCELVP